jgi:hypothetical protein
LAILKDAKFITMNSASDMEKLDSLEVNSSYLIAINSNLNMEEYVSLKMRINELRRTKKYKIKAEID